MRSEDWASQALAHALSAQPTLGSGRLICIDGLAGAGKTTLAASLGHLTGAPVIHADELLGGWGALPALGATIDAVLRPLADGRRSSWRRWDWHASQWAETHLVEPAPLLVIDGVGCGASAYDDLITTLVWIEAAPDVRLARGLARDGDHMRAEWEQWLDDEAALHVRERTRERADLVYSTSA
ncbi:MAG: 4-amino-4-deoxy-L-arabinose transferase [Nocardioides sp.]|jgi:uridine kinase|uniref:uridine kinase family protein n=1 Tax=Nocardioides sp. TaxID=35761 RepID=UPI0026364118|nr:4-amino-4-deoxy-L-arabinose transferase [Nocardioides sp.]MCW2834446.1 4-amino-4-deoxy-L-arabinose transferase [Nocardioides sp.]